MTDRSARCRRRSEPIERLGIVDWRSLLARLKHWWWFACVRPGETCSGRLMIAPTWINEGYVRLGCGGNQPDSGKTSGVVSSNMTWHGTTSRTEKSDNRAHSKRNGVQLILVASFCRTLVTPRYSVSRHFAELSAFKGMECCAYLAWGPQSMAVED